jgi:hypothetical protein
MIARWHHRARVRYRIAAVQIDTIECGAAVPRRRTAGAGQADVGTAVVGCARCLLPATTAIQELTVGGRTAEARISQCGAGGIVLALVTLDATILLKHWNRRRNWNPRHCRYERRGVGKGARCACGSIVRLSVGCRPKEPES